MKKIFKIVGILFLLLIIILIFVDTTYDNVINDIESSNNEYINNHLDDSLYVDLDSIILSYNNSSVRVMFKEFYNDSLKYYDSTNSKAIEKAKKLYDELYRVDNINSKKLFDGLIIYDIKIPSPDNVKVTVNIKNYLNNTLNDDDYDIIATSDLNRISGTKTYKIIYKIRARNGFGAKIIAYMTFIIDIDGNIIEVIT